jgi:hypothetical protein
MAAFDERSRATRAHHAVLSAGKRCVRICSEAMHAGIDGTSSGVGVHVSGERGVEGGWVGVGEEVAGGERTSAEKMGIALVVELSRREGVIGSSKWRALPRRVV